MRWTCKSAHALSAELFSRHGIRISDKTVAKLLREHGYSLQAPNKSVEGAQHPDRNAQFEHINAKAQRCIEHGVPVISVDTKKKELVGNFKNGGREWQPAGEPELVDVHDFPGDAVGKAIPYGIYDVASNDGFVSVGVDHDTPVFIDRSVVEAGRRAALLKGARIVHHGGRRRQQQLSLSRVEAATSAVCRHAQPGHPRQPLPARHEQMEQGRASTLLVYLGQLARQARCALRDCDQLDQQQATPPIAAAWWCVLD